VSVFTCAVTVVMLGMSKSIEERLGTRFGMVVALVLSTLGRALYGTSAFAGGLALLTVSLLVTALGEGILQPVAYAGIKKYTDEKSGAMGYAMLYAMMNAGIVVVGLVSPLVRVPVEAKAKAGQSAVSGVNAVNLVCLGTSLVLLLLFWILMTKKTEANVVRPTSVEEAKKDTRPSASRVHAYFIGTKQAPSPFRDARFVFFIFMLLPVRTLFAHQWLTMPEYVLRSYSQDVADKMEWLVDSMNPLIIFLAVPTITAVTKRFHVYTMMIAGTAVSALSTFLLCGGPRTSMLILYFFVFSIGEALWSARFLEYARQHDKLWTASTDDHQHVRQRPYRKPPSGTPRRYVERLVAGR